MIARRLLAGTLLLALLLVACAPRAGDLVEPGGEPGATGAAPTTEVPEAPTPEATRGALPRLKPGQTVCQGLLHVPEKGEPRAFADIYTQHVESNGIAIVAPAGVSTEALEIARKTVERVLAAEAVRAPLVEQQAYIVVADTGQGVLDLPEFACLEKELGRDFFSHVCGIADRADYPVATVNEADLLGDGDGPCGGLNILYHELGHLVQNFTLSPTDYIDVRVLFQDAKNAGKYEGAYARTNTNEYFAEGTQAYFLSVDPRGRFDRRWLREYDPGLYSLLERVYEP